MFTHTCSACERRQLIFPSQITAVTSVEAGVAYHFTCWCGQAQTALEVTEIPDRRQVLRAA